MSFGHRTDRHCSATLTQIQPAQGARCFPRASQALEQSSQTNQINALDQKLCFTGNSSAPDPQSHAAPKPTAITRIEAR
jgi:hypothetical protein